MAFCEVVEGLRADQAGHERNDLRPLWGQFDSDAVRQPHCTDFAAAYAVFPSTAVRAAPTGR